MLPWLLRKIGISDEFVRHLDSVSVHVQHPAVLWVGLALLIPVGVYIYLRQRRNLASVPLGLRSALTATRVAVLLLLVGVLADPYLRLDYQKENKPIVAVLFDHSQSMQLPAGPFEKEQEMTRIATAAGYQTPDGRVEPEARKALNRIGRAKLAQDVVQHLAGPLLEPLAKKFDVQYYAFDREARRLTTDPAHPELADPPNPGGPNTYVGDAITTVLNEAAGRQQVAGIVLLTDGQNTGGRSLAEVAQAAASAGTPIYTVPVGTSSRLRDVAVVDVFTSGLVSVGDTARVAVTLESTGFDNRAVKVELREGEQLLDSKDLVLQSKEQQQVELTFQAKTPGPHYLMVQVPPQPEEPDYLRTNNTDIAFVRVSDEKLRVLYVDGLPRWDFRFLKNAMRRDHGLGGRASAEPDIVLEAEWRRRTPEQQAAALPRTVKDLAEYHTVILGDASPQLLDSKFIDALAEAVRDKGVGLIVAPGPLTMPQAYDERLRKLLPVRLRRASGMVPPIPAKPFRLELTPDGSVHEAMRFYDDPGRNQNAWSNLPPFYWCTAAERPAPGATVLAWEPQYANAYGKLPVIAHQYAGKGRVMLVGTDSTWLWRQNVGDRFFYKFWGQSIRFVARRDQAGARKSWMDVRPLRAQPGEQAQVELMAFTGDGTPRDEAKLSVEVSDGKTATAVELAADPTTKGRYTGRFPLQNTGEYHVTFDPAGGAEPLVGKVRVLVAPEELRHPNVNRPALEQLATASGGRLVELPDLATIADRLQGETKLQRSQREATLWDNWLLLALLVGIFSVDVGIRRLTGLS